MNYQFTTHLRTIYQLFTVNNPACKLEAQQESGTPSILAFKDFNMCSKPFGNSRAQIVF